ncbi:MAG TPA: copper-binding protein [Opitutaceae bacterium]|nr:copper-binding protein [Opitutaceae bacterium]
MKRSLSPTLPLSRFALPAVRRVSAFGALAVGWLLFQPSPAAHANPAPPTSEKTKAPARHSLRGVIVDVYPERKALLVKHEEIPGVMRAMTMLLKAGEDDLKAGKKGLSITGYLVRRDDGWWIEQVQPAQ